MLHLIKIELKKQNINKYLIGFIIAFLCIFFTVVLLAIISRFEEEELFLHGYQDFIEFSSILIRATFSIFSGVMLANIVISEYSKKTIQLLYSYPIARGKLLGAKLIIIVLFCFLSMFFASFLSNVFLFFGNKLYPIVPGTVPLKIIYESIGSDINNALLCSAISLIPLYFGMKKYSTTTTIVSSVLISLLLNSNVSMTESSTNSLFGIIVIPLILSVVGLLIAYSVIHKINYTDVP